MTDAKSVADPVFRQQSGRIIATVHVGMRKGRELFVVPESQKVRLSSADCEV